jgi:hypothetical protein
VISGHSFGTIPFGLAVAALGVQKPELHDDQVIQNYFLSLSLNQMVDIGYAMQRNANPSISRTPNENIKAILDWGARTASDGQSSFNYALEEMFVFLKDHANLSPVGPEFADFFYEPKLHWRFGGEGILSRWELEYPAINYPFPSVYDMITSGVKRQGPKYDFEIPYRGLVRQVLDHSTLHSNTSPGSRVHALIFSFLCIDVSSQRRARVSNLDCDRYYQLACLTAPHTADFPGESFISYQQSESAYAGSRNNVLTTLQSHRALREVLINRKKNVADLVAMDRMLSIGPDGESGHIDADFMINILRDLV